MLCIVWHCALRADLWIRRLLVRIRLLLEVKAKAAVIASVRTGTYKTRGSILIGYGANKLGSAKLLDSWGSVISPVRSSFMAARLSLL
jgi:hypothetical protein